MGDRGELPIVRIGSRRVRIRRKDLEEYLGHALPADRRFGTREIQGSAWAAFGVAMAEATGALQTRDNQQLVKALESVSKAAGDLAKELRRSRRSEP
jgi:hypothetical protein